MKLLPVPFPEATEHNPYPPSLGSASVEDSVHALAPGGQVPEGRRTGRMTLINQQQLEQKDFVRKMI